MFARANPLHFSSSWWNNRQLFSWSWEAAAFINSDTIAYTGHLLLTFPSAPLAFTITFLLLAQPTLVQTSPVASPFGLLSLWFMQMCALYAFFLWVLVVLFVSGAGHGMECDCELLVKMRNWWTHNFVDSCWLCCLAAAIYASIRILNEDTA